jgi:hypothetical protein
MFGAGMSVGAGGGVFFWASFSASVTICFAAWRKEKQRETLQASIERIDNDKQKQHCLDPSLERLQYMTKTRNELACDVPKSGRCG